MQAILANYRLTTSSGIGLAGIGSFSFTHRHWSSSSSFISAGQLFQPHRRTSGGFREVESMLRELCSHFVGIFCWDKIFKKIHLKQYPPNAAGAMLKFCWDKI